MRMRTNKTTAGGITSALIYTRVSGDEQEREGLSLPAQLAGCRRYVQAHGWIIGGELQDVMSGKRDDRPQYRALLAEVRRLRADGQNVVVVVKWLHRFGRRVAERVRCWEELAELGVAIHSVAEGGVVLEVVANILASIAQEESRQIGERVASTWAHVTALGWAKTTTAPWGYQWRSATTEERAAGSPKSVLQVDPDTAEFVVEAYRRVADGESARGVARWAARLPEAARGGRRMTWRTVQDILRRSVYAGRPVQGVPSVLERPLAKWPAIVDDDVWQRVQSRADGHQHMPRQASGRYVLTGLLRCPACGGRMRGEQLPKGRRYRCGGVDPGARCTQSVDAAAVERLALADVWRTVDAMVSDPPVRVQAELRKTWQARQTAGNDDHGQKIHQLKLALERSRKRITRATELFVDGSVDKAAYDALVAKAREDVSAADKEIADLQPTTANSKSMLPPLEGIVAEAGNWITTLQSTNTIAQRKVLGLLVNRIVPVRERPGVYHVEIMWTPLGEVLKSTTGK
jgi:DNA invertase Pin-like site-specific DNA recombinase